MIHINRPCIKCYPLLSKLLLHQYSLLSLKLQSHMTSMLSVLLWGDYIELPSLNSHQHVPQKRLQLLVPCVYNLNAPRLPINVEASFNLGHLNGIERTYLVLLCILIRLKRVLHIKHCGPFVSIPALECWLHMQVSFIHKQAANVAWASTQILGCAPGSSINIPLA